MIQPQLSPRHLVILQGVLAPYRARLSGVSVFGSRATGRSRPNSDIDLVIFGAVGDDDRTGIWADLEDSDLPVTVDVVIYNEVTNDRLRDHIDRVAVPLPLATDALDGTVSSAAR